MCGGMHAKGTDHMDGDSDFRVAHCMSLLCVVYPVELPYIIPDRRKKTQKVSLQAGFLPVPPIPVPANFPFPPFSIIGRHSSKIRIVELIRVYSGDMVGPINHQWGGGGSITALSTLKYIHAQGVGCQEWET